MTRRDDGDAKADFQPLTFVSQSDLHEQLLRACASNLRLTGVKDAPLCKALSALEEGRSYDYVYGRRSLRR